MSTEEKDRREFQEFITKKIIAQDNSPRKSIPSTYVGFTPGSSRPNQKELQRSLLCNKCGSHTADIDALNCYHCNSTDIVLDEMALRKL